MANRVLTYVVEAVGKGLTKLKKDTQDLGKTLRSTQTEYARVEKSAGGFYNTQAKGVIGTANATKSFSKLSESLGSGGGIVGVYATLAANIFAVSAAFNALRSAAQLQQVMGGLEAAGNKVGLTYSVATSHIKEMADGMLSTEQAARSAAQVFSAGFKLDSLERMTKLSKDVSIGLGRNMTDSMDRLSRGVIKLEPELLDELGIMTKINESNTIYAAKLHKNVTALTNFEKRQGFMNAVLAEGELKFGGLSDEVGNTTAYDKLSATFADLSKNIFGSFTGVFGPIANLLSKTKLGLVGVGALFLTTIRKQILPGLSQTAERIAALSEKEREAAGKALKDVKSGIIGIPTSKKEPSGVKDLRKSIDDGTVSLKSYDNALISVRDKEKKLTEDIAKHENGTLILGKKALANRVDQLEVLESQNAIIQKAARSQVDINEHTARANIYSKSAFAIGQAGSGNVIVGAKALKDSISDFSKTGGAAGEAASKLQTGMFAAGKGVQFLGAAFLRILPWLGIIALAIGVISLAIKHLRGLDTKEYLNIETAFSDLNTTLEESSKKMEAFRKAEESSASISLRTAQTLIIKANAITEVSQRYLDAVDAIRKYQAVQELKGKPQDENKALVFGKARVETLANAGINFQSDLGKTFAPLADTEAGKPLLAALGELNKWDSKSVNRELSKYRKQIQEAGKDTGKLAVIGEAVATGLANSYGTMADAVASFQNDVKAAGTSMSQFLTASLDSTPYDDVVNKLTAVSNSISTLKENAASVGSDQWKGLLAGFTPDITQFMDTGVKQRVDLLNTSDAIIKNLKAQEESGAKISSTDRDQLINARDVLKTRTSVLNELDTEFDKVQKLFKIAQDSDRISKGQIAVLQARGQATAHINSLTAQGVRDQLKSQQQIVRLEIASLEARKAIFETVLKQSDYNASELDFLKKGNAELQKTGLLLLKNRNIEGGAALDRIYNRLHGTDEERKAQMAQDRYNTDEKIQQARNVIKANLDGIDQQIVAANGIIAKDQQRALVESSIVALKNQQAVLQSSLLSKTEIEAQAQQKNVENLQATLSTIEQIRDVYVSTAKTNKDIAVILSGRKNTLKQELGDLQDIYVQQTVNARTQGKTQLAAIGAVKNQALAEIDAGKASVDTAKEVNDLYTLKVDLQNQLTDATVEQLRVQNQLAILEKVTFDTAKEGLDWQKEGLNNLNDQLDASRSIQEATLAIDSIRRKISNRKMGIEDNSNVQKAEEIRAASLAYKLAVDEASVKKTIITLEFELLKEQRRQLLENLKTRRESLLAATDSAGSHIYDQTSDMVKQLNASVASLESIDLNKTRDFKIAGVDQNVMQKKLESDLAQTFTGTSSPLVALFASMGQEFKARAEAAQQDANTARTPTNGNSIIAANDNENPATKAARLAFQTQAKKSEDLITALDKLRMAIEEQIAKAAAIPNNPNSTSDVPGTLLGNNAQVLAKAAEQLGTSSKNLATVISYETKGTFSPNIRGGKNNNHIGLIQFGKDEQIKYGAAIGQTFAAQMDAVVKYLKDRGFKPGMSINDLYSTINAGSPGHGGRSDDGGKTTVDMHVARMQREHSANANKFLYGNSAASAPTPVAVAAPRAAMEIPKLVGPDPLAPLADVQIDPVKPEAIASAEQLGKTLSDIGGSLEHVTVLTDSLGKANLSSLNTQMKTISDTFRISADQFRALGPEGEVAAVFSEGMANMIDVASSAQSAIKTAMETTNTDIDKGVTKYQAGMQAIAAVLSAISSAITMVSSLVSASANAKEAAIDREIAAEQKRDGKSAGSVEKIKALEQKKDAIARKAFNTNKKLMMANAVIAAAAGVAQALGSLPFPANFIVAGITAAMGAAQLAIISGTQYQSTASGNNSAKSMPDTLTIGKRGDGVDLARNNTNVGGELGYLRGSQGSGSNSGNFALGPGSAYGGPLPRGYGNAGFMVGEKGPERIYPTSPVSVKPINDNENGRPLNVQFHVTAFDGQSVEDMLFDKRGQVIDMIRGAANESGNRFLEDVNTSHLKKTNTKGGGRRI